MFNSNAIVVGVADVGVSADPHAALVTYGLGSCIAVLLHDRACLAAGCLHFMLPDSQVNPARARACQSSRSTLR